MALTFLLVQFLAVCGDGDCTRYCLLMQVKALQVTSDKTLHCGCLFKLPGSISHIGRKKSAVEVIIHPCLLLPLLVTDSVFTLS